MLDWDARYKLSRFALLRPVSGGFLFENPFTKRQCTVKPSVLQLLSALLDPVRPKQLLESAGEGRRESISAFLSVCEEGGFLTRIRDDGSSEEDQPPLALWEFHDLLFHAHSRLGRNPAPVGGTYRWRGRIPQEPPLKTLSAAISWQPLAKCDGKAACQPGRSFIEVLESRRSSYNLAPVSLAALSEFMYYTCRVTQVIGEDGERVVKKSYPSGGSMHPLEVYVIANSVPDLPPGLYAYDSMNHALGCLQPANADVLELLRDAALGAGGLPGNPSVLFVIAARFGRTAWKYESIAYRLVLLEAGALIQTMYLAASAMGLGGCALGAGDSDRFARIIGSSYYAETSVGEFMLGGGDLRP